MKKVTLLLCLFLFSCSSDNPVSSNADPVNGKITFEFEAVPPYRISYPNEDLSTNIKEFVQPKPNDPSGLITKTTRTFDYKFLPFSNIRTEIKLTSTQIRGNLTIRVFIETDSTKLLFTSKDFTTDKDFLQETIRIPF